MHGGLRSGRGLGRGWLAIAAVAVLVGTMGSAHAGPPAKRAKVESDEARRDRIRKELAAAEKKKPWIKRWAPERNMLEAGLYFGAFVLATQHSFYDPGFGMRPEIRRGAFAFGGRVSFYPLSFLGVGLETGVMGTRSPELDNVRAQLGTFRLHVIGQLPYRVTPTLVIGGGILGLRSRDEALGGREGAFHWGPGLKIHVHEWVAVRVDGRHIVTTTGADDTPVHHGEVLFGVDVTIRLKRILEIRRKPSKLDGDEDGVADSVDSCPDIPAETTDGCPANHDRDGDGTPDRRDRCPEEYGDGPGGCPIPDADSDGILDDNDSCVDQPETFNGVDDKDGCPDETPADVAKLTGVLTGITFDSGKATIRPTSRRTLETVVKTMKKYPDVKLEITGHTDDVGPHASNVTLSQARADAVKTYIVDKGIAEDRIRTRGAGPDQPIAENKTAAGKAKNRRIEFRVVQ